jgi:hypothetical protein
MEVVSRARYIVDKIYDRFHRSFTGLYGDRLKIRIPVSFAWNMPNIINKRSYREVCELLGQTRDKFYPRSFAVGIKNAPIVRFRWRIWRWTHNNGMVSANALLSPFS